MKLETNGKRRIAPKHWRVTSVRILILAIVPILTTWEGSADGLPYLNQIVVQGSYAELERELEAQVWTEDELGGALIAAAGVNKPEQASLLIESGADVDYAVLSRTGLIVATYRNNAEVALVLLEAGADPNYISTFEWRPIHNALGQGRNSDSVIVLLLKYGAEVDAVTSLNVTPLHRAASFCHPTSIRLLLANGANSSLRDHNGLTAVDRARRAGCDAVVRLLE